MTKPGDSLTTKKTLHELAKEFPDKTYKELEKYRDADRREEAQQIITQQENEELKTDQGKEIDYHRYWKKRAEEAEGELSILKGIETNRVKEAQAKCDQLQNELDRIKEDNNDCYNRIADLTESLESKDYFEKPDYKYLIEENRKLEQERNEVLATNKKLILEIEDRVPKMRKSGLV